MPVDRNSTPAEQAPACDLCAGKCRGHSLTDESTWEPEPGSRAAEQAPERYITLWRKPGPDFLDWDSHISLDADDAAQAVKNLKAQGVWQFHTYRLGAMLPELSSED